MEKVCILMSTYNGEKYIREQLNSLIVQQDVEVKIVIRDDGSTDNTCKIIECEYPMIELHKGNNIGCEKSFMSLLYIARNADYYAFCDQDDFWMYDKLKSAVNSLMPYNIPAIYGCNLIACDENLNPINIIHKKTDIERIAKKSERDFLCNMHGSVLVWNKELQKYLRRYRPKYPVIHDVWVNTVANSIGKMIVDENPHILYRLHKNNVSGYSKSLMGRLMKGIKIYLFNGYYGRSNLAKEVLNGYSYMINKRSSGFNSLIYIANYKNGIKDKIRLINSQSIKDCKYPDKLFWILCIILEKY